MAAVRVAAAVVVVDDEGGIIRGWRLETGDWRLEIGDWCLSGLVSNSLGSSFLRETHHGR